MLLPARRLLLLQIRESFVSGGRFGVGEGELTLKSQSFRNSTRCRSAPIIWWEQHGTNGTESPCGFFPWAGYRSKKGLCSKAIADSMVSFGLLPKSSLKQPIKEKSNCSQGNLKR